MAKAREESNLTERLEKLPMKAVTNTLEYLRAQVKKLEEWLGNILLCAPVLRSAQESTLQSN